MFPLRQYLPITLATAGFLVALWTLPAAWCRWGSERWFEGDSTQQLRLARTVAKENGADLELSDFKTGSSLFNGEWLFGTYLMSGIGFCQMVREHPELRAEWEPKIEHCIRQLLSQRVREFDRMAWQEDAIESLDRPHGHVAYLGYFNFLLSLYRQIKPQNEYAALNDRITATLCRRFSEAPTGLIATYPNEWYPVDNAPALASIALFDQATGSDNSELLKRGEEIFRKHYMEPKSGLLYQAINMNGTPRDLARGSGSALGVFFLHHAYPELGREIYQGIKRNLESSLFGFGAVREYPHGASGVMDIDSGPIIWGFGFSATGFTLGPARAYGDKHLYAKLYSSAVLAGAPSYRDEEINFLTGGPLGNAILLAMLTTSTLQ